MDHTEEKHYGNINLLCRVCGNLSYSTKEKKRSRKLYPVEKLSKELKFICGYTLSTGDYYSKFVCFKCVCSIKNCYERRSLETQEKINHFIKSSEHLWVIFDQKHTEDDCSACKRRNDLKSGYCNQIKRNAKSANETKPVDSNTKQTHNSLSFIPANSQQIDHTDTDANNTYTPQQSTSNENITLKTNTYTLEAIDQRSIVKDAETEPQTHSLETTIPLSARDTCLSECSQTVTASPARSDTDAFLSMAYDEWQSDIDLTLGGHKGDSIQSVQTQGQALASLSNHDISPTKCKINSINSSTPIKKNTLTYNVTPVKKFAY